MMKQPLVWSYTTLLCCFDKCCWACMLVLNKSEIFTILIQPIIFIE